MASLIPLLSLPPLEAENIGLQPNVPTDTNPHHPPPDIHQLQADVINVLENRVDINDFDELYQAKIRHYYQYSATVHLSKYPVIAKRTSDTIDLV